MRVFIGYDPREHEAAMVCAATLQEVTHGELVAEFLEVNALRQRGLLTRLRDERGTQDYDLVSNHTYSTRFNISRFLVPILCQGGPALFLDCDMVFLRDPRQMLQESLTGAAWDEFAVSVVKHDHAPTRTVKMLAQAQNAYPRKNWSSVILFNCDHRANRRLSLWDVNNRHRDELHSFYWLHENLHDPQRSATCRSHGTGWSTSNPSRTTSASRISPTAARSMRTGQAPSMTTCGSTPHGERGSGHHEPGQGIHIQAAADRQPRRMEARRGMP